MEKNCMHIEFNFEEQKISFNFIKAEAENITICAMNFFKKLDPIHNNPKWNPLKDKKESMYF